MLVDDVFFLSGIFEVVLVLLYVGEIMDEVLVRYVGFLLCFWCEVGVVGCDMCGIFCVY